MVLGKTRLREHRRFDEREFRRLRPAADELVQTRLVWVAEAYGPSDFGTLIDGLRRLGLDEAHGGADPITYSLQDTRGAASRWQHGALPMLRVRAEAQSMFYQVASDLPVGVRAIIPSVLAFPGSLTVLVFCALFDEHAATAAHRVLCQDHPSEGGRYGRGWRFEGPDMRQRAAVQAAMRDQRRTLERWVEEHLPGAFAGGTKLDRFPASQLVTYRTSQAERLTTENRWAMSLGVPRGFRAYRSTRWKAVRMSEGGIGRHAERVLVLGAREQALLPRRDENGHPLSQEDGWWLLFQELQRSFEGTLSLWALRCLFDHYLGRLAEIRDLTAPAELSPRKASRRLQQARRELEVVSDARAVAGDVAGEQDAYLFKSWDGGDWIEEEPFEGWPPVRWIDNGLSWAVPNGSAAVQRAEQQVRERLVLESQLFAAGAGLRLQRTAFWVASAALTLALVAAVLAYLQWQYPQ
jgi:hypothetical protein